MKKLKYTKKIQNETQTFIQLIDNLCNKLNKEYARNMNRLLENIAEGEKLDINMLKDKYLKTLDISTLNDKISSIEIEEIEEPTDYNNSFEEIIFDKIILDGNNYYYENKENGKIYDSKSKIVGYYKNNKFVLCE
jgi:hypothetical protein